MVDKCNKTVGCLFKISVSFAICGSMQMAKAQNNATLYGIVDDSIIYQSSQTTLGSTSGGRSNIKMGSGSWAGSRFGLRGSEDLGGGNKANYQLESGFNLNSGAQQYQGALFGRQAWVGISNDRFGALTLGRQYTPYYFMMAPFSPTNFLTGFGAHPGDLDALDTDFRANNSIVFTSPSIYGLTASGSYSLGGVPGSTAKGSTWSAALQYMTGHFGAAVGFLKINNSNSSGGAWGTDSTTSSGGETGVSAVTNGYQGARAQDRWAVGLSYFFSSAVDVAATYTNVQYLPGSFSRFTDNELFNTAGAFVHWKPGVSLDLTAGYSFTWATKANGIDQAATYHQIVASEYYSLSKRTALYALQAFQRARGRTLASPNFSSSGLDNQTIAATASIGDGFQSSPSSSGSMTAAIVGIIHRF